MLSIRNGIFETNSSSSDYYYDDDDTPSVAWGTQLVRIILEWKEDLLDSQIEEIVEKVAMEEEVQDIILSLYEDDYIDDLDIYDTDDGNICYVVRVYSEIEWEGGYYPATRYSPAEYHYFIPVGGPEIPPKKDSGCVKITKAKEKLMKLFKEKGYTQIVNIESVYGEEIDDFDI